jgi:hypothetical protein
MSTYGGILGAITESLHIQQELGCSPEEAEEIRQRRSAERRREAEMAEERDQKVIVLADRRKMK